MEVLGDDPSVLDYPKVCKDNYPGGPGCMGMVRPDPDAKVQYFLQGVGKVDCSFPFHKYIEDGSSVDIRDYPNPIVRPEYY